MSGPIGEARCGYIAVNADVTMRHLMFSSWFEDMLQIPTSHQIGWAVEFRATSGAGFRKKDVHMKRGTDIADRKLLNLLQKY